MCCGDASRESGSGVCTKIALLIEWNTTTSIATATKETSIRFWIDFQKKLAKCVRMYNSIEPNDKKQRQPNNLRLTEDWLSWLNFMRGWWSTTFSNFSNNSVCDTRWTKHSQHTKVSFKYFCPSVRPFVCLLIPCAFCYYYYYYFFIFFSCGAIMVSETSLLCACVCVLSFGLWWCSLKWFSYHVWRPTLCVGFFMGTNIHIEENRKNRTTTSSNYFLCCC